MLASALRHCSRYEIGPRKFPAGNIDESDSGVPEHRAQGYTGVILSRAEKE